MSRIGKKPIKIPEGVTVNINERKISVKGPKGTLEYEISDQVEAKVENSQISVTKIGKTKKAPAIWGTTARIIANMLKGVSQGFEKSLELNGVGYRMNLQGKKIIFALGFSHPVEVNVPENIEVKIEGNKLTVSGTDKQKVGQFAAEIRSLRPVEPYKGKGFRYVGEIVRKKEGKKAVSGS